MTTQAQGQTSRAEASSTSENSATEYKFTIREIVAFGGFVITVIGLFLGFLYSFANVHYLSKSDFRQVNLNINKLSKKFTKQRDDFKKIRIDIAENRIKRIEHDIFEIEISDKFKDEKKIREFLKERYEKEQKDAKMELTELKKSEVIK